jgi:prephenate dehydrogenase
MAAVHLLPELLAVALVDATVNQPGWIEARKLAGRAYARASLPLLEPNETDFHGQAALLNKQNTLRVMDNAIASLRAMRQTIADGDEKALADRIREAIKARDLWLAQRQRANWDLHPAPDLPKKGEFLSRMFGFGFKSKKN